DNYTETEFNTIIPRGSRVPCSFSNNYAPATDNQKEIKVNVYERSAKILPDDNNIDKCNFIGSIPFNDFQSGKTTDTIINVKFEFDKSRILRVKLTDVRTGSTKTKVLDKKKHKIAPQNLSPEPMDIFLLIDSSGSMEGSKINSVRKAIKLLLTDMIDMNISRVGIISFDETHKVISKLTSDKEYIINKTKEIITGGGTCPSSGFEEAYKQLKATRTQKKQAVIMLTDGVVFSCDKLLTKNACQKIRDSGMRLITIGAGADINKDFLEEIASENNGRKDMYTISNMEQLASTFRQIINSLRKL
ncbi:MAG: VWA domain-containing protein, partial [Ruminococcus sp.]